MQIEPMHQENAIVFKITGRIDASTSSEFEQIIFKALEEKKPLVLLSCADLEFISSSGLRVLLMAAKRLKSTDRLFGICGLNPSIREVFDVSGFSNLFNMYDSAEDAIRALPASSNP